MKNKNNELYFDELQNTQEEISDQRKIEKQTGKKRKINTMYRIIIKISWKLGTPDFTTVIFLLSI